MNIPILYEDDYLMVVDKPAGLLVIPTPKNEKRTLTSILNEYTAEKNASYQMHPCHRLDRETSGAIIYAKGKSPQQKMMELFKQRQVVKQYLALVQGVLPSCEAKISFPIEGQKAITLYRVKEQKKDFAIVEVALVTGRTNQIRIHFKHIGHPLVGETRFAFRRDAHVKAKRCLLHAQSLKFTHPFTGKPVTVAAPLPKDFEQFLTRQEQE